MELFDVKVKKTADVPVFYICIELPKLMDHGQGVMNLKFRKFSWRNWLNSFQVFCLRSFILNKLELAEN